MHKWVKEEKQILVASEGWGPRCPVETRWRLDGDELRVCLIWSTLTCGALVHWGRRRRGGGGGVRGSGI